MTVLGTRTISASVGRSGRNKHSDVVTVQELLNDVPVSDGGPTVKLKVDGLSGSKTVKAIQVFQLHNFGWKGADGRVDPGKQTIQKLNEINSKGTTFLFHQCRNPRKLLRANPRHWFFMVELIRDTLPFPRAMYWFGNGSPRPALRPMYSQFISGHFGFLRTPTPCMVTGLAGSAVCRHLISQHKKVEGTNIEKRPDGTPTFNISLPVGMDADEPAGPNVHRYEIAGTWFTDYRGRFQLIS